MPESKTPFSEEFLGEDLAEDEGKRGSRKAGASGSGLFSKPFAFEMTTRGKIYLSYLSHRVGPSHMKPMAEVVSIVSASGKALYALAIAEDENSFFLVYPSVLNADEDSIEAEATTKAPIARMSKLSASIMTSSDIASRYFFLKMLVSKFEEIDPLFEGLMTQIISRVLAMEEAGFSNDISGVRSGNPEMAAVKSKVEEAISKAGRDDPTKVDDSDLDGRLPPAKTTTRH